MLRRAGLYLLTLALVSAAGVVGLAGPATAGGWAVTVIDPAGPIEPGKAQRVSFWVLQHGTHPYNWSEPAAIGTVGLTLSDDNGSRITFAGTSLPEPAHYVTTVTVPSAGRWKVTAVQGVFAGYHVGTLTVPGTFKPLGVPAAPSAQDLQKYWPDKVQPPVLEVDQGREPFVYDDAKPDEPDAIAQPAPANAAADPAANYPDSSTRVLIGTLALLLLIALALGGRWWARRGVPQT